MDKPRCECGHTVGQHFRVKYRKRESRTGCSRCICFEYTPKKAS